MAPVEVAEQRLAGLNRSLQKELTNIDAVADLAADRLANLEDRFQSQISDLFQLLPTRKRAPPAFGNFLSANVRPFKNSQAKSRNAFQRSKAT